MDDKSIQRKGDVRQSELLTVREVATYLRVSRVTVWRWCKLGIIPAFQIGRNWRIRRADLLDLERHPGDGDGSVSIDSLHDEKEGLKRSEKTSERDNIAANLSESPPTRENAAASDARVPRP